MSNRLPLIDEIFEQRAEFLVIGLTGRTGSGCTTVAKLLEKDFASLSPSPPKKCNFENDEERKYKIIYEYAKNNWPPDCNYKKCGFYHLKVSFLLAFYLLEHINDWLSNPAYKNFLKSAEYEINVSVNKSTPYHPVIIFYMLSS